jgi:ribosomal protein L11 methyltransferase
MAWLAVTLVVPEAALAYCEAVLEGLAASAITTLPLDEQTQPVLEPAPGATPKWSHNRVQALFPVATDVAHLRAVLTQQLAPEQRRSLTVDFLEDQNWLESWRQHAVQACFGERLWLLPKDAAVPKAAAGHLVLRMDPGLAFGSGGHPTTQLCLQWLAQADLTGKRVLDFGCGSGVLAVAAHLLGAAQVDAVDIDPQALTATRNNADFNEVPAAQLQTFLPEQLPPAQTYDVVVANILANPLVNLAPTLLERLAPNGQLVLAGLLESQQQGVAAAYPDLNLTAMADQEWVRLAGGRKGEVLGD